MPRRSNFGGRHELGQNLLKNAHTIGAVTKLVAARDGSILELGAGDGALTVELVALRRPLTAIDIDEHRIAKLQRRLPKVHIEHADALRYPFDSDVLVSNVPFHITTPLLRRMLRSPRWQHAVLLTQWEVARKRAGVGGGTMMTAQAAPWFDFALHARVPATHFSPRPSVDGGILTITRRQQSLLEHREQAAYSHFVGAMFAARGNGIAAMLAHSIRAPRSTATSILRRSRIDGGALPRDLGPEAWARLWRVVREKGRPQ